MKNFGFFKFFGFFIKKEGRKIPKRIIEARILEVEATNFANKMREDDSKITDLSLSKRQENFKKNEEKTA